MYVEEAFTGFGAGLHGGRWNSQGTAMIYTAANLSLAQLEVLVNLEAESVMAAHWVYFEVLLEERGVLALEDYMEVPEDLFRFPLPASTRRIGDQWVGGTRSVALSVPSVLTPGERNFLLNPRHPDYASVLQVGQPHPLSFDLRLIKDV